MWIERLLRSSVFGLEHDLRAAVRTIIRKPGFALTVVATIAIASAGASAVWAVANAVVFRALPFPESERLVRLGERHTDMPESVVASYESYVTWRDHARSFDGVAATRPQEFNLETAGDPLRVSGARLSGNYFDVMRVAPLLGRTLIAHDDLPSAHPVVILGERLWRRAFGSDPNVVGRDVRLDGVSRTVVGVMPALESLPSLAWSDMFVPFALDEAQARASDSRWLLVTGRLRSGVSIAQAAADVDTLQAGLRQSSPATHEAWGSITLSLDEWLVGRFGPVANLLLAAGALMVTVCGFNLASLMSVQALQRRQELAMRTALGAGRHRLIRLALVEGAALGAVGVVAGLALALVIIGALAASAPALQIPRLAAVNLPAAAAFGIAAVCVCGAMLLQVLTVLAVWAMGGARHASAQSRGSSAPRRIMLAQRALTTAQLSMALTAIITAVLLARSFDRVQRIDPGFSRDGILSFQLALPAARYRDPSDRVSFVRRVLNELSRVPGVTNAAVVQHMPLGLSRGRIGIEVPGAEQTFSTEPIVHYNAVGGGYFETLQIRLVEGRWFTANETWDRSADVVVVNEALAARYVRGSPVGQSLRLADDSRSLRIVGVAGDVRRENIEQQPEPELFVPLSASAPTAFTIVARASGDPLALASAARAVVMTADPLLPIANVMSQRDVIARAVAPRRMQTLAVVALALVTSLLAGLGVYGLIARAAAGRSREFGVRLAMGAHVSDILRLVLREGLALGAIAVTLGGGLAAILAPRFESLLYQTKALDPMSFAGAAFALIALALGAAAWPAYRAARTNAADILRQEG